jgi:uncharacterized membrane protein
MGTTQVRSAGDSEKPVLAAKQAQKPAKLRRAGWRLLAFFAVTTGLESLRYALPHVPFPAPLPNFIVRHNWLIAHAIFSSVALLAGPWQFLSSLRRRSLTRHRRLGRIYCIAVAAGWVTSLPIASHAQTGAVASAGFLALGAAWIGTTGAAYFKIRQRQVRAHREWMIRSYALTAAAITLRIYLPICLVSGVPYAKCYPLIAWLCWIPNWIFAEWLISRSSARAVEFRNSPPAGLLK